MPGNGLNPATLRRMMDGYNAAPQAELLGLSPNQVMQLLDGDWRTTGAVRLTSQLTREQAGRAWAFGAALAFLYLVIDQGSAPVTATGNLTRKFVALAVEALDFPPGYLDRVREYNKVINEPDFGLLFELRHTLVEAVTSAAAPASESRRGGGRPSTWWQRNRPQSSVGSSWPGWV